MGWLAEQPPVRLSGMQKLTFLRVAAWILTGMVLCAGCREGRTPAGDAGTGSTTVTTKSRQTKPARYVGSSHCRECHEKAYADWAGSHHALAEREIDAAVDAKAFRGKGPIRHGSLTSRVRETNGKFEIVTMGLDGKVRPHVAGRVIGVRPLRQYMIEAEGGRFQVAALSSIPHLMPCD